MDSTTEQWNFAEGTDVVGSDGDKVGEIVAVQPNYIVVEKGFFFPTDYYIPTSAVANYDGDKVYLSVTKDDALNQGWDTMPTEDAIYTETTTTTTYGTDTAPVGSYSADMGATDVTMRDTTTYDTTVAAAPADTGMADYATERTTTELEGDTLRVPVHEEELSAVKREREVGQVEITKDVVAEEQTLEVPLTEERVRVQRNIVDREVTADDTAFEGGTIEVPLRAEEVELQKRTRVAEEIEIEKEAVQRTEQVTGTVRREVVDVSERVVDDVRGSVHTAETDLERGAESVGEKMRDAGRSARDAVTGDDASRR
jgi:uncharacterized protein (TIGR02271 family)